MQENWTQLDVLDYAVLHVCKSWVKFHIYLTDSELLVTGPKHIYIFQSQLRVFDLQTHVDIKYSPSICGKTSHDTYSHYNK